MWVAAASFFWGPQQRVPEMIRIPLLQAIAVLIPLGVMVYWLWRYRRRRRAVRAITSDGAVGTA
jgi:membrane protein DedA with SNARE-associated domain